MRLILPDINQTVSRFEILSILFTTGLDFRQNMFTMNTKPDITLWEITMKTLIIGGTGFLGRYLVEAAQRGGHMVTLFNRGQSNPNLFQQSETILGDREEELNKLSGRQWDAAIETCGYVPRIVRLSRKPYATLLNDMYMYRPRYGIGISIKLG